MGVLRCEELYKSFDGNCALAEVTLALPPAGVTAIIGPNGAGKTTLINILTGFLKPNAGRCFFGKDEITSCPPHRIARLGLARTFQDLRLIQQMTVLDNVMLGRPNQRGDRLFYALFRIGVGKEEAHNREEALRVLGLVGLVEKANELAGELSYGEQKLLTLACCMATDAGTLLLDEPVSGVHPEMISRVLAFLVQLRDCGKGVIFIEHDIGIVREIADTVILMDEGKVIANGPTTEVLAQRDIMETYLG